MYHVAARGNEQKEIYGDDSDRPVFLNPAERRNLLDGFVWLSHRAYSGRGNAKEIPPWLSLELNKLDALIRRTKQP